MDAFKAYAKINLSLDVCEKRSDGYHTLRSVVQTVSLADEIFIEKCDKGIAFSCSDEKIPDGENLCFKAADLFFRNAGTEPNVRIILKKHIPVTAGLGGGSADAAALLKALNKIYGCPLDKDELLKIGLSLGSDVPVCMECGTVLMEGVGEKLTRLPDLPDCHILIAKKGEKGSTGEMYRRLDAMNNPKTSDLHTVLDGLTRGDLQIICGGLYNCFEAVYSAYHTGMPGKIMRDCGALYSGMSGAGPSVFGIFENECDAKSAEEKLSAAGAECFLCMPVKAEDF